MKKEENHVGGIMAGLGIAAVAAGVIGTYLYRSKDGAKKRKEIKSWMLKAKAEVLEKAEDLKEVTEDKYEGIVDTVAAKYKTLAHVGGDELQEFVEELKSHWTDLKEDLAGEAKKTTKKHKA